MNIEGGEDPINQAFQQVEESAEQTDQNEKALLVVATRIVKALKLGAKERAHQITQDAKEAGMDMNRLLETCKDLKSK